MEADVQLEHVHPHDDEVFQLDPLLADDVDLALDVVPLPVFQILQDGGQPNEQVVYCVSFDLWMEGEGRLREKCVLGEYFSVMLKDFDSRCN